MALWGISTTSETVANNFAIPKFNHDVDRNKTPWNTFADVRGWIQRRYKTRENSGISTRYFDEVLVPVVGLNSTSTGTTGLGTAGPVAVFFEDPNLASSISVGGGATTGIGTGRTGYVHIVFNELVFCSAGATVLINAFTAAGISTGTAIVGTAASNTGTQYAWAGTAANHGSPNVYTNYNGQITNRVAFAFTAPNTGIGTVLRINVNAGFVGVITDGSSSVGVISSFTSQFGNYLIRNVGGAGTTGSLGLGTTTLTVTA